jgi:hypothetical protein
MPGITFNNEKQQAYTNANDILGTKRQLARQMADHFGTGESNGTFALRISFCNVSSKSVVLNRSVRVSHFNFVPPEYVVGV